MGTLLNPPVIELTNWIAATVTPNLWGPIAPSVERSLVVGVETPILLLLRFTRPHIDMPSIDNCIQGYNGMTHCRVIW
ncbi:hypothetical protein N7495_005005 [Penicillium taxi]|uniref:uncharacterized protein n=1 Tax=Penicillium taxi TaxID=168475 RepID=UPI002545A67A|nr:uncharacterized protein N7495_005005 [Penicillium taxi]KAJ5893314.1 hypothetical protein N7495_005005 [Penicillium taxi]